MSFPYLSLLFYLQLDITQTLINNRPPQKYKLEYNTLCLRNNSCNKQLKQMDTLHINFEKLNEMYFEKHTKIYERVTLV